MTKKQLLRSFESWVRSSALGYSLDRKSLDGISDDGYQDERTTAAWAGFQAAVFVLTNK